MNKRLLILLILLVAVALFAFFIIYQFGNRRIFKYENNFLGYEITYQSPWRIASYLSLETSALNKRIELMDRIDCNETINAFGEEAEEFFEKDMECFRNHPEHEKINQEYLDFFKNWKIEDSDYIALTDLSVEEENDIVNDIKNSNKTFLDFPAEHLIQIYPSETILEFEEETATSSDSKLVKTFVYLLNNDIKSFQVDLRKIEGPLAVNIPFEKELISGKLIKSLVVSAKVNKDSKQEAVFYKILNSIILSK